MMNPLRTGIRRVAVLITLLPAMSWASNLPDGAVGADASMVSGKPAFIDRVSVTYLGTYEGPSVGSPSAYLPDEYGRLLDETGAPRARQKLTSQLYVSYRVARDVFTGVGINAEFLPVGGADFVWRDPMLYTKFKNLVRNEDLKISADLRAYLPWSDESRVRKVHVRFGSQQNILYRIRGTRFELGSLTSLKWSLLDDSVTKSNDLGVYFGPVVSYQISPRVSAMATYEAGAKHKVRKSLTDWNADGTDLLLGADWLISDSVDLYPYLKLMTGGKISANSTTLGAQLSAKIL